MGLNRARMRQIQIECCSQKQEEEEEEEEDAISRVGQQQYQQGWSI